IDHEMKKDSYVHSVLYNDQTPRLSGAEPAAAIAPELEAVPECPAPQEEARRILPRQVVCGYTCMESDRLCVLHDEAELRVGDMMILHNAGAYSLSFTPGFFIDYPPAVYAKNAAGEYTLVCGRVTP
ncbi:MAG: hypothetical protein RR477_04795, partial [Raoultibacter sp.]